MLTNYLKGSNPGMLISAKIPFYLCQELEHSTDTQHKQQISGRNSQNYYFILLLHTIFFSVRYYRPLYVTSASGATHTNGVTHMPGICRIKSLASLQQYTAETI